MNRDSEGSGMIPSLIPSSSREEPQEITSCLIVGAFFFFSDHLFGRIWIWMREDAYFVIILGTLMRFYHAGSTVLFYGWTFLGYCVILCVLEVGSEYKQNTEVMEMSKV